MLALVRVGCTFVFSGDLVFSISFAGVIRSQCPGTRDLPSSGHGVSRESGSVAAAWIACLDSRYSVVDSRSVRHVAQGVLAHIGLFLRRQCISGKIGTIRSRKISKLINSESSSKFEIRKFRKYSIKNSIRSRTCKILKLTYDSGITKLIRSLKLSKFAVPGE